MGAMGISGLLDARNAAAEAQLRRQMQQSMHMEAHSPYGLDHRSALAQHHHHQHQHPMSHTSHMTFASMNAPPHPQLLSTSYMSPHSNANNHPHLDADQLKSKNEPAPKAFACSTCSKKFARRSDLARHERIHSGIRPHACDYPGCGKQFIQRSALTVHARVHTGEKPHMCERCGKPFSDSSSLARHRRIHSGKRPYQCPFANCQKTFTRRTTLTRHQNNHAGTVEQAEAETNAKLAMTQPQPQTRSNNSSYSDAASRNSTVSPTRPVSISPTHEVSNMANMQKQSSEFAYMSQNQVLPAHLRNDYHHSTARANPGMSASGMPPFANASQSGPHLASHPSAFRPPQTMERPTSAANEGAPSPHLSNMGWVTENNNNGMASPGTMDTYSYQDPASYGGQALYYPGSNIRRPQSTEPEDYGLRPRYIGHHLTAGGMPMSTGEWNPLPMNIHEIKQERAFAS